MWCRWPESNGRPTDYESVALPTELHRHTCVKFELCTLPSCEKTEYTYLTVIYQFLKAQNTPVLRTPHESHIKIPYQHGSDLTWINRKALAY